MYLCCSIPCYVYEPKTDDSHITTTNYLGNFLQHIMCMSCVHVRVHITCMHAVSTGSQLYESLRCTESVVSVEYAVLCWKTQSLREFSQDKSSSFPLSFSLLSSLPLSTHKCGSGNLRCPEPVARMGRVGWRLEGDSEEDRFAMR